MSGKIPVKSHETPLSNDLMGGGTIQISTSNRSTEELAEERIEKGIPPAPTDTLPEMESQGLYRCNADGQWLPRECFSPDPRKRNGLQSICKEHRAAAEKQRDMMRLLQAHHRNRYRKRKEK